MGNIPLNLIGNRSNDFTLNITGLTNSEPSIGKQLLGFGLNTVVGIGTLLATGAICRYAEGAGGGGGGSSVAAKPTQEQQAALMMNNEAVTIARTMSSSQISTELAVIKGDIQTTCIEMKKLQEQALGEKSQAYITNQANIKTLEDEYGFASDSIQDKKDATAQAKAGDAYQQAAELYETLRDGKKQCEDGNLKIEGDYKALTGLDAVTGKAATGGQIGEKEQQIRDIDTTISNLQTKKNDKNTNDIQKTLIKEQIFQQQTKKQTLETELNELKRQKKEYEDKYAENKRKLQEEYTPDKIDDAKKNMDKLAKPQGHNVDYASKYTEYKTLKENNIKILADADVAKNSLESYTTKLGELKGKQTIYQQALKIKGKITEDDTIAATTEYKQNKKGKDVGKGSWWSRNFGWIVGKGNTAKTQRTNRATYNQLVRAYMDNHGCSKKEAKKAIDALNPGLS